MVAAIARASDDELKTCLKLQELQLRLLLSLKVSLRNLKVIHCQPCRRRPSFYSLQWLHKHSSTISLRQVLLRGPNAQRHQPKPSQLMRSRPSPFL